MRLGHKEGNGDISGRHGELVKVTSVLVHSGCGDNIPWTGQFIKDRNLSTLLEAVKNKVTGSTPMEIRVAAWLGEGPLPDRTSEVARQRPGSLL